MNYCLKCSSLYSEPGTCNCYAPQNVKIETAGATYERSTFNLEYRCPGCQKPYCDGSTTGCPVLKYT